MDSYWINFWVHVNLVWFKYFCCTWCIQFDCNCFRFLLLICFLQECSSGARCSQGWPDIVVTVVSFQKVCIFQSMRGLLRSKWILRSFFVPWNQIVFIPSSFFVHWNQMSNEKKPGCLYSKGFFRGSDSFHKDLRVALWPKSVDACEAFLSDGDLVFKRFSKCLGSDLHGPWSTERVALALSWECQLQLRFLFFQWGFWVSTSLICFFIYI